MLGSEDLEGGGRVGSLVASFGGVLLDRGEARGVSEQGETEGGLSVFEARGGRGEGALVEHAAEEGRRGGVAREGEAERRGVAVIGALLVVGDDLGETGLSELGVVEREGGERRLAERRRRRAAGGVDELLGREAR